MARNYYPVLSVFVLLLVDTLSKGRISLYDIVKTAAVTDAFLLMPPGWFFSGRRTEPQSGVLSEGTVAYGKREAGFSHWGRNAWIIFSVFWMAGVCIRGTFHILVGIVTLLCFIGLGVLFVLRTRHISALPPPEKEVVKLVASSRDEREQDLYRRILDVMEKEKPWINEHFRLNDLVSMVYSNRQAVSNAVNRRAKTNFCRFVNGYRIEYAKELVRKDPRLTVGDVSMMCGFHNDVSFSMAFQLVENMTPNEWIRKCRHGKV